MKRTLQAVIFALGSTPAFAIANPASEFCVKMGGRLGDREGFFRRCIIEEWTARQDV